MYQGIHYDYRSNTAFIRDDEDGIVSFGYQPVYYKEDPNGEFLTLDGKRVSETTNYNKYDTSLYEKDVDKNLAVLLELYKDIDEPPKFHKKVYLDIETEIGGAINLAYCEKAPVKVTGIALYDNQIKKYYAWVLDESVRLKNSDIDDAIIISCVNEVTLLNSFLDKWKEIDPTVYITWNGDSFDTPYLYCRMKRKLGENRANQLSPIGIVRKDDFDVKMPYKIGLVASLDLMRLYKKFIPKQQPSYSLDAICTAELGRGKIKYDGSLDTLFKTDIKKYIEYNVNDVRLIVDLDEKKKFVDLAIMVCHMGHVPYWHVYQSSKVVEGAIMTYLKRKNIVSPNKPTTMNPDLKKNFLEEEESEDDEKFAGAYVKEPIPGKYSWNGDLDLESLYPSLGILLNAGLESLLFKIVTDDPFDDSWNVLDMKSKNPNKVIQIENISGKLKDITIGELLNLIEENEIIISPNGVAFDSNTSSVVVELMLAWFKNRKEFKNTMKEFGEKGDMVKYVFYDLYQQVMKVFLNSIYGCLGLASFRYTDGKDFLASAITSGGRLTIMRSADYVNDKINNDCNTKGDWIIMSDTDSLFQNALPILKKHNISATDDNKVIPFLREYFINLAKEMNVWYEDFCTKRFNSKNNRLKIKSELVSKSLYVSAKKQYAQYIVDKEGVAVEMFDFKGLDFMKASFPKLFKDFCQQLIKDVLFDKPKSYIDKSILSFRDNFKNLSMQEVSKPSGINKLKENIARGPRGGDIFSTPTKGTMAHIRSAIYYNDLVKFKQLDDRYPIIQSGDKIKWMYLKTNPYNLDVLGYSQYDSPPELLEYISKYMDRETMFDKNLCKKLQKIYDNMGYGAINFNKNVNKFVKYAI